MATTLSLKATVVDDSSTMDPKEAEGTVKAYEKREIGLVQTGETPVQDPTFLASQVLAKLQDVFALLAQGEEKVDKFRFEVKGGVAYIVADTLTAEDMLPFQKEK